MQTFMNGMDEIIIQNRCLVKTVIGKYIRINESIQGMGYDDLYQTGCMALCHAAGTFNSGMNVPFSAYARVVIRNKLIDHCRQILRLHHNQFYLDEPMRDREDGTYAEQLIDGKHDPSAEAELSNIITLLDSVKPRYKGVTLKGIDAIKLKIIGYSGKEIAEIYGVSPNNVGAWISRAASKLREDDFIRNYITP